MDIHSADSANLSPFGSLSERDGLRSILESKDTAERIKRRKYRGYSKRSTNGAVYCGDTTNNKPATKIDAKVKPTLQREVTDSDFTMRHEYDFDTELRIFEKYRYHAVSLRPRKHTIRKKGGEDNDR